MYVTHLDVDGISADVRPGQRAHHTSIRPHVPDLMTIQKYVWDSRTYRADLELPRSLKSQQS